MTTTTTEAPAQLKQPAVPPVDELQAKSLARAQDTARELSARLFTPERIELIKRQICPAGITDAEFAVFLEQCRRSGLDPLMKEAYCVPRKTKVKDADGRDRYVEVYTFQAAEQGMQVRAHRSGLFRGLRSGAVYTNDVCEIDFAAGLVRHSSNVAKPRGDLLGAWAVGFRSDLAVSPVAFVRLAEYRGESPLWANKPETMIVKVARAHALRLLFPYEFAGAYIPEELEGPGAVPLEIAGGGVDSWIKRATEPASTTTKRERIAGKLERVTPAAVPAETKPNPTPPAAPKEIPLSAMRFGSAKGRPLLECTAAQLVEGLELAQKAIADNPTAPWVESVRTRIGVMRAEQERRAAALEQALAGDEKTNPQDGAPARQPGEEG